MDEKKQLILCVDDDPDVLTFLRTVLEAAGFAFAAAESAEAAWRAFRKLHPDALIVDMMMEEVDAGTRFVKQLRAEGHGEPIFMLSSVGDSLSYTLDTEALGLSGVFQKPLRKEHLFAVLRAKLSKTAT